MFFRAFRPLAAPLLGWASRSLLLQAKVGLIHQNDGDEPGVPSVPSGVYIASDQEPHFFHKAFNLNWFQTPAGEKVPSDTEEQKPKGNDIFLIRHGQYFLSTGSLSDTGRIQAFYTGLRLREELEGKRVKIFSSNMLRAQQTAAIIAKIMDYQEPIVEYEEMREACPSTPELGYERKLQNPVSETVDKGFNIMFSKPEDKDLVKIYVIHANLIRYYILKVLQCNFFRWLNANIDNGSISHVRVQSNGRVSLRKFGEASHIPKTFNTFRNLS